MPNNVIILIGGGRRKWYTTASGTFISATQTGEVVKSNFFVHYFYHFLKHFGCRWRKSVSSWKQWVRNVRYCLQANRIFDDWGSRWKVWWGWEEHRNTGTWEGGQVIISSVVFSTIFPDMTPKATTVTPFLTLQHHVHFTPAQLLHTKEFRYEYFLLFRDAVIKRLPCPAPQIGRRLKDPTQLSGDQIGPFKTT